MTFRSVIVYLSILLFIVFAVGLSFISFLLARNESVLKVRHAFIDDDATFPELYRRLPPYGEMVNNPCHYLRWTKAHWLEYLEGQCAGCQYEIEHEGKKVCRTMTRTHGQQCDAYMERKE